MRTFTAIAIALAMLLLLFVPGVFAQAQQPKPAQKAPAGAITPDAKWLKDFDEFNKRNTALGEKQKANQAKLDALVKPERDKQQEELQPEIDSLVGFSRRLVNAIPGPDKDKAPNGYQFDSTLRVFVPIPTPPAAAPGAESSAK